jgi:hypothetical protein
MNQNAPANKLSLSITTPTRALSPAYRKEKVSRQTMEGLCCTYGSDCRNETPRQQRNDDDGLKILYQVAPLKLKSLEKK